MFSWRVMIGAGRQVLDQHAVHARRGRKVKVCQRLLAVAAGLSQTERQATLAAPFQFVVEQQGQELGGAELTFHGLGRPQSSVCSMPDSRSWRSLGSKGWVIIRPAPRRRQRTRLPSGQRRGSVQAHRDRFLRKGFAIQGSIQDGFDAPVAGIAKVERTRQAPSSVTIAQPGIRCSLADKN